MDKDGKLTEEEQKRIKDWIDKKQPGKLACDVCHTDNWLIGEHIIENRIALPNGGLMLGGITYPYFTLMCMNCGNTKFFNVAYTGVVDREEESDEDSSEK